MSDNSPNQKTDYDENMSLASDEANDQDSNEPLPNDDENYQQTPEDSAEDSIDTNGHFAQPLRFQPGPSKVFEPGPYGYLFDKNGNDSYSCDSPNGSISEIQYSNVTPVLDPFAMQQTLLPCKEKDDYDELIEGKCINRLVEIVPSVQTNAAFNTFVGKGLAVLQKFQLPGTIDCAVSFWSQKTIGPILNVPFPVLCLENRQHRPCWALPDGHFAQE